MISRGVIEPPPCPDCGQPMVEVQPKPVKWHCPRDAWYCRLEQGFIAKQVLSRRERYTFEGGEVGTQFRHKPIRTNPSLRYLFYKHPAPEPASFRPLPASSPDGAGGEKGGECPNSTKK